MDAALEHRQHRPGIQLIQNIARHSDLVWFSPEPPGTNDAHYHHCKEQPARFCERLFRFFGFGMRSSNRRAPRLRDGLIQRR